jgi:hypothetical protein
VQLEHGWSGTRAYCQSKLAQIMFTFSLAERLAGVSVNALHPATYMHTKMVLQARGSSLSTVEEGALATERLILEDVGPGSTSMGSGRRGPTAGLRRGRAGAAVGAERAPGRLTPPFLRGHDHARGSAGPVVVVFGDYEDPDSAACWRGVVGLGDWFTAAWRQLPIGELHPAANGRRWPPRARRRRIASGTTTTSSSPVRMRSRFRSC